MYRVCSTKMKFIFKPDYKRILTQETMMATLKLKLSFTKSLKTLNKIQDKDQLLKAYYLQIHN